MNIVNSSFQIINDIDGKEVIKKIEQIGRVCYKSENSINEDSAKRFVNNLIKRGHESVIEHITISVKIVCDRGISHEIVRHRIASYSQESTRYCNYINDRFGNELTFIRPYFWNDSEEKSSIWWSTMETSRKIIIEN